MGGEHQPLLAERALVGDMLLVVFNLLVEIAPDIELNERVEALV